MQDVSSDKAKETALHSRLLELVRAEYELELGPETMGLREALT